jgi:hypothetical protein
MDTNVERLAQTLGNMTKRNGKLLSLILSGNQISDHGAIALATVMMNLFR